MNFKFNFLFTLLLSTTLSYAAQAPEDHVSTVSSEVLAYNERFFASSLRNKALLTIYQRPIKTGVAYDIDGNKIKNAAEPYYAAYMAWDFIEGSNHLHRAQKHDHSEARIATGWHSLSHDKCLEPLCRERLTWVDAIVTRYAPVTETPATTDGK